MAEAVPMDARRIPPIAFAEDVDAKRVLSLAHSTLGVIHGASLAVHSIGIAIVEARGINPKRAIKQGHPAMPEHRLGSRMQSFG